ncbi:hypothetical protein AAFF_G00089910 [Aldrovandia affinis]|uniref:Uncharacterized protein n=1 Tax=Aldrovandia affinis TaxID=143900 RepID=A0AAD7WBU4_9TELE|nr:hypothetical protein AAFF_G00089910 [Aldrovandia affinis]
MLRGKFGQNQERLEAENVKIQELKEKIRILESEKGCVELRAETLQQRLEAQLTLQQTLDSENNDRESKVKEVIRSQTREMQELKEELEQTESLFKTEVSGPMPINAFTLPAMFTWYQKYTLCSGLCPVGEVLLKNRKIQIKDKLNIEMKNKRALGELQNMRGQWMDQALQQ